MQPVSYDRHCKSCHAITLPGAPAIPLVHDRLDVIRAQLDSMPDLIDRVVNAAVPPADNAAAVARVQEELDHVVDAIKPLARDNKDSFNKITEFLRGRAAVADPAKDIKATTTETTLRGSKVTQPHAKRVEWAVVFASEGRCTKCHDVRGEIVPGYIEPTRPLTGDPLTPYWETLVAAPGTPLQTVATGMPVTAPRRWFANARYDHRAHRSVNCLDCHAGVQQSTRTSDLSLPNLDWRAPGRPNAKSCVDCHHAGPGGIKSACVTCHLYHNSRLERAPVGQRGVWNALAAPEPATAHPAQSPPEVQPVNVPGAPSAESSTAPPASLAPAAQPAPSDLPPPPDAAPALPGKAPPATDLPPPPDAGAALPSPDLPPPP
jgi:hypothetical protein